jgi:hypothetical protein
VLYPLANVAHVLALMVFFAAVAAMDVRILGGLRSSEVAAVLRPCRRIAAGAFLLQAASGLMLLAPEASTIAINPAFAPKMLLVVLGLVNVAILEGLYGRSLNGLPPATPAPAGARVCALVSLIAWLATAALGRLIAYL